MVIDEKQMFKNDLQQVKHSTEGKEDDYNPASDSLYEHTLFKLSQGEYSEEDKDSICSENFPDVGTLSSEEMEELVSIESGSENMLIEDKIYKKLLENKVMMEENRKLKILIYYPATNYK